MSCTQLRQVEINGLPRCYFCGSRLGNHLCRKHPRWPRYGSGQTRPRGNPSRKFAISTERSATEEVTIKKGCRTVRSQLVLVFASQLVDRQECALSALTVFFFFANQLRSWVARAKNGQSLQPRLDCLNFISPVSIALAIRGCSWRWHNQQSCLRANASRLPTASPT